MSASFDFSLDPFAHFQEYFAQAQATLPKDPHAMSLATVSADGQPSVRTVYFKGFVREGFSFYTNYESAKGQDLMSTKRAALLFYWAPMNMQVRVEGSVEKLTRTESETYFKSRPRLSQLGAWASHQSQKISSHEVLKRRVQELDRQYEGQEIPCPNHWGGFHLLPMKIEFWFSREGRLHERYLYERESLLAKWETSIRSP
jgi:pyridoxamine 5'-phosphate oxidase